MLTYTSRRNLFGSLANTTASANLTLADTLMNESERKLVSMKDWDFLQRQYTLSTIATTFTVTIASPGVFTLAAHGFVPGQVLYFSTTSALPTGLTAGTAYYVITAGLTASAFQVSTTIGGAAVNTSGTQAGTHTVKTATYILPAYTKRPESAYVTIGGYRYTPKEVTTRKEWDQLNEVVISSNIPTHYYIYDGCLNLFPQPSQVAVVSINARRIYRDLSIADYTTGTVDIVTNGSTTVTGSGTTWTAQMVGRFIAITASNTANTGGDGVWYEIAAVTSTTSIVLKKPYMGISLTTGAGAAYVIGDSGLLPETYQTVPVYEALSIYFTSVDPNAPKAALYAKAFADGTQGLYRDFASKQNVVLDSGGDEMPMNGNLYVTL